MKNNILIIYVVLSITFIISGGSILVSSFVALLFAFVPVLTQHNREKSPKDDASNLLDFIKLSSSFAGYGVSPESDLARSLQESKLDRKAAHSMLRMSCNGHPLESVICPSKAMAQSDSILLQALSNFIRDGGYSLSNLAPLLSLLNENRVLKGEKEREKNEAYFRVLILLIINSASMAFLSSFGPLMNLKGLLPTGINFDQIELTASLFCFSTSLVLCCSEVFKDFGLAKALVFNSFSFIISRILLGAALSMAFSGRL